MILHSEMQSFNVILQMVLFHESLAAGHTLVLLLFKLFKAHVGLDER